MYTDPREMLNQANMARLQFVVIAITVALNALDGIRTRLSLFRRKYPL